MQKRNLKKVFSYLFAFFIAFFLFMIVLLNVTKFTVMSSSYFMKEMESVDYYRNTAAELNRMIQQNAAPAGLPVAMFEKYIQVEDIRADMMQYQDDVFAKKEASIPTERLKERLTKDITSYAAEKKIQINATMQAGIDAFITTVVDKYLYLTQFPYLDVYASLTSLFTKVYWIAMPLLLIALGVVITFLYRLYSSFHRKRRYYAYSIIGGGLLTLTLPMYLYITRFFEKIHLNPQYMYELLVLFLKNYLSIMMIIGGILIVIGVLFAYINLKRNYEKQRVYPHSMILEGIEKV